MSNLSRQAIVYYCIRDKDKSQQQKIKRRTIEKYNLFGNKWHAMPSSLMMIMIVCVIDICKSFVLIFRVFASYLDIFL